jgi:hypothetical protein
MIALTQKAQLQTLDKAISYQIWTFSIILTVNPLNAKLNPIFHLLVLLEDLTFMGLCIVSIFQYIYNKIQRLFISSLFISRNCSTCFGWYFHPSSGAHTTTSTEFGICHTFNAICRYRGGVGTGLSVLWVVYATHSTLKLVPTLPR